jgi:ribosomal protein S18 acetylase RimI-like enzyme
VLGTRHLGQDDWAVFRDIRLSALFEAPYAFGSRWEIEKELTEAQWRANVVARTRFVVELDGRPAGLASGGDSSYTGAAALTSLWVDPAARGKGVGDLLVTTVVDWAQRAGYDKIFLWVAEGNDRAERLYERNGFARTGELMRNPQPEFEMGRRL